MRERNVGIFSNIDWLTVMLWFVLVLMGWGNIYAAVYNEEFKSIFDISQKYGKQMLFIAGAVVIALIILIIDGDFYTVFAFPIYLVALGALVLVLFLGTEVSGSKSWFRFGDFGLQPAEFAKFATNLALAKYLSRMDIKMTDMNTKFVSGMLILLPFVLILLENETGVALVYVSFIFVLYREGLSGNILLFGLFIGVLFFLALLVNTTTLLIILIVVAVLAMVAAYFLVRRWIRSILLILLAALISIGIVLVTDYAVSKLPPHQKSRINVWLGKEISPEAKQKEYYNVNQALIAIGSGGFTGKGYLQGTQTKYDFVPEQDTDFIFCTVGEEWGFLGSSLVILLFLTLIIRIIFIAERQRSPFSRIYGYGVASILFFHISVNIGMTIGLVPVIGIPLPFFSYGGSSLWAFTILLFIFLRLDSHRLLILR